MSADSLRESIARTRRDRRRIEGELNRLGTVLVRLSAYRETIARGETARAGSLQGAEHPAAPVVDAVSRLVAGGADEEPADRRDALAFLGEPLLSDPTRRGAVDFFDRAATFRSGADVADRVWRVVTELDRFLDGDGSAGPTVDQVRRLLRGRVAREELKHLHALVGFAATAARRERERLADRLNSDFDGIELAEAGLVEDFLEAVGDDPLAGLDEQPIVMLPVRIETRFVDVRREDEEVTVEPARRSDAPSELRIRVFPDQVHVDAHEEELTDEEVRAGKTFWSQLWYACHHVSPPAEDSDVPRERPYDPNALPPEVECREAVAAIDDRWDTFSTSWPERYVEIKERAWRRVVEGFGRERAAYVVHALRPTGDADRLLAAGEEDEHPWGRDNGAIADLSFPDVPRRPDAWTAQPRARLLPDRWVAHATWRFEGDDEDDEADDTVRHVSVTSHAVREPLPVGPDPETVGAMADDATGEGAADDGSAGVPPGLEWLVDFDEALRAGMAMTVTEEDLGVDPATGTVETLLVVGVKTSMSAADSADAIERLLDAHHYSSGLELLEGGTPSNNADVPSSYASADDPVGSMATELGAPLVDASDYSDGDRLARALGIEPEEGDRHVFAHVDNADGTTDRWARHMNNALWPATVGYSLQHTLVDNRWGPDPSLWADADDVDAGPPPDDPAAAMREGLGLLTAYRRHFVKYVRGGGPFPALRVGEQPYGVLPVTPLATQADESEDEGFTWYDAWRLAPVFEGDDDDTPELVTDFTPTTGGSPTFGRTTTASNVDPPDWNDPTVAALTDGAGGFVPRRLERKDHLVAPHLATWVERFASVWREAVRHEANVEPVGEEEAERERIRPVPRVGEGLPLTDVLEMEASSSSYLRKSVFTDPLSFWELVGTNDDGVASGDVRQAAASADLDLSEADVDALVGALDPPSDRAADYDVWRELYTPIADARERQRQAIRETLRRYDLTDLDPRVANFLYEDALTGGPDGRTIDRLVDDDVDVNIWLLQQLSYQELRTMGVDERAPGADSTTAGRRKQALVEEQRALYPGTEPVVQKSLLRVLLRFSTMQEFLNGRIQLGALYDDPVVLGPDPARPPATGLETHWLAQLYDLTPSALADHPELERPDIDRPIGNYLDAVEYFRGVGATDSPVPAIGDFTYSLNRLQSAPVDELERQLTRTLDLASHRLDAWWTSIATRRLFELRTIQGSWVDRHRTENPSYVASFRPATEVAVYTDVPDDEDAESEGGDDGDAAADESTRRGVYVEEQEMRGRTIEGVESSVDVDATATGPATDAGVDLEADTGSITADRRPRLEREDALWPDDRVDVRPDAETAAHVGAYAFVEDVAPDPATGDTEFVHAPSVEQATTASLLRSAHQSHGDSGLADALAIDLSADRVRLATALLDGVRSGQSLGALLGYRFERALHEDHDPLEQYIPAFRALAPGVTGRLKHGDESASVGGPAARSDVVDGYALYRQYVDGEIAFYEGGDGDGEGLSEDGLPREEPFDDVFERALATPIDALNDLLTAESVHQLAKGNVERASSSVDSLVAGRLPQEPEVTRTSRSGRGVTHRLLVLFDLPAAGESPAVPDAWDPATPVVSTGSADAGVLQVRPGAEPLLNAWIGELFPEPAAVSCPATFRWTGEDGTDHVHETAATLADLELSPLDALYLTQDDRRAGTSQLEGRFDYRLRRGRPAAVPVDADLELEFAVPASDDALSVAEFLELAGAVRTLVLDGRAADGEDLAHPADGLGPGFEATADGRVDPAGELAERVEAATARLEAVRSAIDDRTALLEPPDDEPNLLDRVDATVEAVEAFAERITPRSALSTGEAGAPSRTARLEAFEDRVAAVDDALTGDAASTPDGLLAELGQLRAVLPVGPTDAEAVGDDVTVEPGVPLAVTGDEIDAGDPPEAVDLEAWSRSPASDYHEAAGGVPVDASGGFSVELDLADVEPGTPLQLVARAAGHVVYRARVRVTGAGPDPDELATALAEDLPTVAALVELAAIRDRLEAPDGPGTALQDALDALEDAPHPSAGPGETAVTAERVLIETLFDAGETTLEDDDVDAIRAVEDLVGTGGDAGVELSVVADDLDDVVAPVDRLGLADLVTVTVDEGEPTFWRGDDRAAGEVRERLATIDPDPRYLQPVAADELLRVDPTVARFVEAALGKYAGVLLGSLEALLDAPGGFARDLDGVVGDAGEFRYHLSLLLYHPERFGESATPGGFADRIDALADSAATLPGLAAVLGTRLVGAFASFEAQLRALHAGPDAGPDLEGFLSSLVAFHAAPDPDPGREELHASLGLPDPDGRAAFLASYGGTLADASTDGALSGLPHQLGLLGAVVAADDPATAVRAGVFETARRRLLRAAYFGVYGTVPLSVDGGDPAHESVLLGQLRAASEGISGRLPAADAVAPASLEAPALVERLETLFGEPFVVLPPFVAPNAGELERTFGADLLGEEPLAPETWLQRAAHVRERPAAFREALSYAEAATGTLLRDLSVGQLPETGLDAWVGVDGVEPEVGQVSLVAQAGTDVRFESADGAASSFSGGLAGLFVDEWVEPVPSATETTGVALNFDDPGSRAPQSILLAVPPGSGEWSDRHLRTAVSETLGLSKLRLVDAEALAEVVDAAGLQHLLPALWFPRVFEGLPRDPSVNFEAIERYAPEVEIELAEYFAAEYVGFEESDEADDGSTGGEGA